MPRATVEGGASDWRQGQPDDAPLPVEVPSVRAPKADLVDAAVTHAGLDPDEAAALTKAELAATIAAAIPPPPPPPVPA